MRRVVMGVLSSVVVVSMATALWRYTRAEAPHGQLTVTEVTGEVSVDRAASAGEQPSSLGGAVAEGTILQPADRIATGEGSRAVLSVGRDTQLRVGPNSSLSVVAVDEAGVSLELEGGALQAKVRPELTGGRSGGIRLSNRGREVLATHGEFAMGVSGDILQVSVSRGSLSLSGLDKTRLEEGQQATVVDRHAEVGPIPEELLLAVDWPQEARTRASVTRISGKTQPGSKVTLVGSFGSRTVMADAQGTFLADLPLVEGDNPIEVLATDIFGRKTTVEGMLQTRDTRGPSFQGQVEYGGR